ncbi:MAG: tetratricopeptide repeat protein [Pseudomonadota bacterium]
MATHRPARELPVYLRMKEAVAAIEAAIGAKDFTAAIARAEQLVADLPATAAAWNALGVALRASGRAAAAIPAYRRALEIKPEAADVFTNLGNALKDAGRLEEAVAALTRAVELDKRSSMFWSNLGVGLRESGKLKEALAAYRRAISLDPQNVSAQVDCSQVELMLGNYTRGWTRFEWRWQTKEMKAPPFRKPRWDGSALPKGTIVLWPEQGFGDTMLGVRFAPLVKQRVERVVVGCQPELERLFQGLDGVDRVIRYGEALPLYDVQAPLMSLPALLGTKLGNLPPAPRFAVPEAAQAKLAGPMRPAGQRLKVGIVWSGSVTFKGNRLRATTLDRFLGLAEVPGVQLFSLQKGPRRDELATAGASRVVIDLAPLIDDFADTAAAIDALDLVVMTDSAVAHLAGARGKPVWILLPFLPYWLYLTGRADSPWYPSMRLFRQSQPGDWDGVFAEVKAALSALAANRVPPA